MSPVLLGILTPVVSMLPDLAAPWEQEGTIEDVATVVSAAERLGYDHVTCSEHVAVPEAVAGIRGSRYYDPLATFGYLSAHTSRIRFATHVLVLGYHHPLEIAKRYGTLDQVSGGRLVLGVGVGSLAEEFELLGATFDDRGDRADDALGALRASLSHRVADYEGTYYRFSGMVVDPCARQDPVPLWIGGRTARSLRRAVEFGDAWVPFGLRARDVATMVSRARTTEAWSARPRDLDVVLQMGRPVDPSGDPEGARRAVARLVSAGATGVQVRFSHRSLAHYLEQLEAMVPLAETLSPAGGQTADEGRP